MKRCFYFNDTATTEIYTLSLHDALPISVDAERSARVESLLQKAVQLDPKLGAAQLQLGILYSQRTDFSRAISAYQKDRKSTRLNSSHSQISYAVFCLKKKQA